MVLGANPGKGVALIGCNSFLLPSQWRADGPSLATWQRHNVVHNARQGWFLKVMAPLCPEKGLHYSWGCSMGTLAFRHAGVVRLLETSAFGGSHFLEFLHCPGINKSLLLQAPFGTRSLEAKPSE